jgi:predicted patatin/cPLA2 family phospholipase
MKTGLVLEGGAMRGMFTAGVMDVLMENGITFDGAVGVSAGAVFGCNYKSGQIGRVIRYNTAYCGDHRYASVRNLLRTGNLYSEQFCYHDIPDELDPFDAEAFRASPMTFYTVCTDVRTGAPVYHKCENGDAKDLEWMRASASMPLASRIVKVDGYLLLDGGVADSIPVRFFESIGYERNVIVLTQPKGFVKTKNKLLPAMRTALFRYPAFLAAVADRHERYNDAVHYVSMLEESGRAFVLRPPIPLEIGAMERDPAQLRRVYETGRAVAVMQLPKLRAFLAAAKGPQAAPGEPGAVPATL